MLGAAAPSRSRRRLVAAARAALGVEGVFPVNAGRTALALLLAALGRQRPGRDEVVLPVYLCPSVPALLSGMGLRPRWVDVGPDLNLTPAAVADVLGPRTLAVLAVHMYGAPAAIGALAALCGDAGVPLIDDAAQVMGEAEAGRALGTFGVGGLVSFAQSKNVVCGLSGSGGLLVVSDRALAGALAPEVEALGGGGAGLGAILWFALRYRAEPWTGRWLEPLVRRLGIADARPVVPGRISGSAAALAAAQIEAIARRNAARKATLDALAARLAAAVPSIGFPQYAPGRYLSRAMLALPPGVAPADVRARLRGRGIVTRLAYPLPAGFDPAAFPGAASLVPRLLEFPLGAVDGGRDPAASAGPVVTAILDALAAARLPLVAEEPCSVGAAPSPARAGAP